jgi:hypothetical protein
MLSARLYVDAPPRPNETVLALNASGRPHGLAQRPLGEADLLGAQRHLQRAAWFGLHECAPASLFLLHRLLGLPWEAAGALSDLPAQAFVAAGRFQLAHPGSALHVPSSRLAALQRDEPATAALLAEKNALDLRLYGFARGLLQERLAASGWAGESCIDRSGHLRGRTLIKAE